MFIHHYFNKENKPFLSISDLSENEAREIWHSMAKYLIEKEGKKYIASDYDESFIRRYRERRRLEDEMRQLFINKGGNVTRNYPYYAILNETDAPDKALFEFYKNGDYIIIPIEELDTTTISFTYGDSFVQYYDSDDKKHELIYTYNEISEIIKKHGWPVKNENGWGFVEAHIWSDETISRYRY